MLTQNHIKFINPAYSKVDLNSKFEQVLILQKFGVKTVNMLLTNSGKDALEYYNLCDRNVLSRPVNQIYEVEHFMQIPDLARLNKLDLCPALFQKFMAGKKINVCLLGSKVLAQEISFTNNELCKQTIEIPENLKEKIIAVSNYLECPLAFYEFILNEEENEYYGLAVNITPDFDLMNELYENNFREAIKEYLVEEYTK